MSRLLERLDRELRLESDENKRVELLAKKSCYLSRVGGFAESREIIQYLRRQHGNWRSAQIAAWIMLAEGLLHFCEKLSPLALDRVMRSQTLGLTINDRTIVALASAWKAHLEFETSNFGMMIKSLQTALGNARADDHDANTRTAMVICNSFLVCGDRAAAQDWFLCSRDHALKDGDDSSLEALLYNRAAFSMARLRAANCLQHIDQEQLELVRLGISSDTNLQSLIGIGAFTNFIQLCDARLLILENKFELAIESLQAIRGSGPFADYNFNQSFIDLEIAFCLVKLGKTDDARAFFKNVSWDSFETLDIDERLAAAWMHHMMCLENSVFGDANVAKMAVENLGAQYEQMRVSLLVSLTPFRRPSASILNS
jgi:hypothetical protein